MPAKKRKTTKKAVKKTKTAPISVSSDKISKTKFRFAKISEGHFFKILVLSFLVIFITFLTFNLYKRFFVVRVNGQFINQIEFYRELEKKEGKNILEDLITKKIIYQEAEKQGVNVTEAEVNDEIQKLRSEVEKQGNTLDELLALQGLTNEDLLENVKIQKLLEKILTNEIVVTDEEIQAKLDENKDFYTKDDDLNAARENIRLQIFQEKLTSTYRAWIQEKRDAATVEYLRKI